MGGGFRRDRESYTARTGEGVQSVNRTISQYGNTSKPRVFISFHIEDEAQVDLLRSQAKDPRFDIEFIDYSVKEPFDEKWKTQCTERINQSSELIVMIGPETYSREAVLWEINKAYELGKPVLGVRIYREEHHRIPKPLREHGAEIINWDIDKIQSWIKRSRE
jgi:hypothetical protein